MLHLGNLRFAPADQGEGSAVEASPSSQEALRLAARFLHVEPQRLAEALVERQAACLLATYYILLATYYSTAVLFTLYCLLPATVERQVVIRGEMQHMRNKVKEANEAAEALAKAVYSTLFDDLVQRINGAVGGERGMSIGVLDIFGFEIFEVNRLERLHSCASNYLL